MLKKSLRLRAIEVEEVLKSGHSVRSAHMQVKMLSGVGALRSAAVVAKAVARKATARNTLRRSIYRALSAYAGNPPSGRAVFFLRVIPKEAPNIVIKEEISFLLSQMGKQK